MLVPHLPLCGGRHGQCAAFRPGDCDFHPAIGVPGASMTAWSCSCSAIEPRAVGRRFDLRCTKAGVRRIRVHDTRRTCGSLLAALDVRPRVAMQILRHSKIAITMEIYTMVPDKATLAAQAA